MHIQSSHHRSVYAMDNTTRIPIQPALALINTSNVGINQLDIGITCVSCSLSIIGAILIFVAYCTCDCCRRSEETQRLLLYLTVSDLIVAFGNLAGTVRYVIVYTTYTDHITFYCSVGCDDFCIVQSFITSTAAMWSYFWTTTIAIHLFIALVFCRQGQHPWSLKIFTLIACWLIPLSITITAASKKVLGEDFSAGSGAWCWISACLTIKEQTIWMAVTGRGWEVLMYLITAVTFILLKFYMLKKRRNQHNRVSFNDISARLRAGDEKYLYLWLIGYCLRIWGTSRFFLYAYKYHSGNPLVNLQPVDDVLLHLESFGDNAQAFCTFILFCVFDQPTRRRLWNKIRCRRLNYEELVSPVSTSEV